MIDRTDWPEDARQVQEAASEATWDALERYRDTGEMVPVMKDGRLALVTVDEAMRMRDDTPPRSRAYVSAFWMAKVNSTPRRRITQVTYIQKSRTGIQAIAKRRIFQLLNFIFRPPDKA